MNTIIKQANWFESLIHIHGVLILTILYLNGVPQSLALTRRWYSLLSDSKSISLVVLMTKHPHHDLGRDTGGLRFISWRHNFTRTSRCFRWDWVRGGGDRGSSRWGGDTKTFGCCWRQDVCFNWIRCLRTGMDQYLVTCVVYSLHISRVRCWSVFCFKVGQCRGYK